MSANIPNVGDVRKLDRVPEAPAPVTERDVTDATWLVRTLIGLARSVARLEGVWRPRRIDFEDRAVVDDGTTLYRFEHRFAAPVRWWPVDWESDGAVALVKDDSSDTNTLVLRSYQIGTVTIRVEEAG